MRSFPFICLFAHFCTAPLFAQSGFSVQVESGTSSRLILKGLDAKTCTACKKLDATAWANVAVVVVANGSEEEIAKRPPLAGKWLADRSQLVFEPRFPLAEGVKYRIQLNEAKILDPASKSELWEIIEISIPKIERYPTAKVVAVYPTRNILPENQLKFYVHFSAPMSRGEAPRRVQLLNENGKPVDGAVSSN